MVVSLRNSNMILSENVTYPKHLRNRIEKRLNYWEIKIMYGKYLKEMEEKERPIPGGNQGKKI